jgi:DNA-binding transcriptional LysR family regulator
LFIDIVWLLGCGGALFLFASFQDYNPGVRHNFGAANTAIMVLLLIGLGQRPVPNTQFRGKPLVSHLPDYEAWAIFAKVVEKGSFSGAANDLGLAKTTVSKAVTRLEERLQTTLLHRTTRALSLTESGRQAIERAARILADGAAVEEEILEEAAIPRGLVRLACPTALGLNKFSTVIPLFMAKYPQVEIDLVLTDNRVDIVAEGFDVAIQLGDSPDSSLRSSRLFSFNHMVVGAPAFFERHGRPTHPSELAALPAIIGTHIAWANEWHFSHPTLENCTVQVSGPLRVNNASAAMPSVLNGIALALTPSAYVARALERGQLEHVLAEWSTPPRPVYIVTPPGRARPARVRVLLEFLKAHFAAQPWAIGIDN